MSRASELLKTLQKFEAKPVDGFYHDGKDKYIYIDGPIGYKIELDPFSKSFEISGQTTRAKLSTKILKPVTDKKLLNSLLKWVHTEEKE